MEKVIQELIQTKGVLGIVVLAPDYRVLHRVFSSGRIEDHLPDEVVRQLAESFVLVKEADIVYQLRRVYLRKTETEILLVLMETDAPMAMIRLKIDAILPQLQRMQKAKGLGRFFKRWK